MTTVNIHEAKTHLSRLLEAVLAGEDVIIARAGRPIARLTPFDGGPPRRRFGQDAGLYDVPENFDEPLPIGLFAGASGATDP